LANSGAEVAGDAGEVRVVAGALGLDADRHEDVGMAVLRRQVAAEDDEPGAAGTAVKSKPSPQTSTRSVPSGNVSGALPNSCCAVAVFGFLSRRISSSSSTTSPPPAGSRA